MNRVLKASTSRLLVWIIIMLVQIGWFLSVALYFHSHVAYVAPLLQVIAVLMVLVIVNRQTNPSYKLAWSLLILGVPVVGISMYWLFGRSTITKRNRNRLHIMHTRSVAYLKDDSEALADLEQRSRGARKQSEYLSKWSHYPLYHNEGVTYYAIGDDTMAPILEAIRQAKHFIFMEFFIIREGIFLNSVLDALEEKVKQGVEVRFMYDDFGSATTVPINYDEVISARGIQCVKFNSLKPLLSVVMNNRDHRKIIVVDGNVAFTGGFNLADEYINQQERFGHWKDTGIRIEGEAVSNFVAMFLEMWQYATDQLEDCAKYFINPVINSDENSVQTENKNAYKSSNKKEAGFIQPYADSPLNNENVGETVYLNIINRAKDYIYIYTPYLIIDNEMMTALCNASKSGVDVRIVTPSIPDKKIVFTMTQSYYEQLLAAGVSIYQYSPGFIHAKTFVCDDVIATVGTINLDYRSLYMHFECGVWMYGTNEVMHIKQDVLETLAISKQISYKEVSNRNWLIRTWQGILRLFAPLC